MVDHCNGGLFVTQWAVSLLSLFFNYNVRQRGNMKDVKYDFRLSARDKLLFQRAANTYGCKSLGEWLIKIAIERLKNDKP